MVTRVAERFASEPEHAGQIGELSYDQGGRLESYGFFTTPLDLPSEARQTRAVVFRYTSGLLSTAEIFDLGGLGGLDPARTVSYEHDDAGRVRWAVSEGVSEPSTRFMLQFIRDPVTGFLQEIREGPQELEFSRFETDRFGNLTRAESWADLDNSGEAELTLVRTFEYDISSLNPLFGLPPLSGIRIIAARDPVFFSPHLLVSAEVRDGRTGQLGSRATMTYEFDGSGRPTRRIENVTNAGDSSVSTSILSEYQYVDPG